MDSLTNQNSNSLWTTEPVSWVHISALPHFSFVTKGGYLPAVSLILYLYKECYHSLCPIRLFLGLTHLYYHITIIIITISPMMECVLKKKILFNLSQPPVVLGTRILEFKGNFVPCSSISFLSPNGFIRDLYKLAGKRPSLPVFPSFQTSSAMAFLVLEMHNECTKVGLIRVPSFISSTRKFLIQPKCHAIYFFNIPIYIFL